MSAEVPRPGLAKTIRDSVRVDPFGPNSLEVIARGGKVKLTPNEAEEISHAAVSWLSARLTDDDVVIAAARGMVRRLLGEVHPRRIVHPGDLDAARAALAAVIGGEA